MGAPSRHPRFKSHSRPVHLHDVRGLGIRAIRLEDDPELQQAVMSVHHAMQLTLGQTTAAKIIENHEGRAFVVSVAPIGLQITIAGGSAGTSGSRRPSGCGKYSRQARYPSDARASFNIWPTRR